jgi:NADH-quinone oxidoreductase subunit J
VRSGEHVGPMPAPGVYARHNAVDTPALLPDGSVSEISVPGPLRARGDLRPVDTAAVAETDALASGRAALGPADHPVADDPGTSPGEPR